MRETEFDRAGIAYRENVPGRQGICQHGNVEEIDVKADLEGKTNANQARDNNQIIPPMVKPLLKFQEVVTEGEATVLGEPTDPSLQSA